VTIHEAVEGWAVDLGILPDRKMILRESNYHRQVEIVLDVDATAVVKDSDSEGRTRIVFRVRAAVLRAAVAAVEESP